MTRALTGLSASFPIVESGSPQTVFVQKDAFVRDVMGRIVQSTAEVPVADGAVGAGQVTAECFSYDGFNRLTSAWTVADASVPTCGGAAPADDTVTGWDASDTAYAATWAYSPGGRITSLVKGAGIAAATSTYAYADAAHPAAATSVSTGSDVNSFTYDDAGRTVSRTVDGVTTNLTWDVTSSLTESDGQGGRVVYAYDVSGQRVLQARVADDDGVGTASAYVASGQVDDPNTAATSTGDTTATRYYTFGGSTVAVRTDNGDLALMLGDEQGSTNVMMPVHVQASGALVPATLADAAGVTRTSYTPYGQLRGADNTAVDRGWLGQVEDRVVGTGASSTGTGLTYLNARYYDPVLSRFLSPDPLRDLLNPASFDSYAYAFDNPVTFSDASGLFGIIHLPGPPQFIMPKFEERVRAEYVKTHNTPPSNGKVLTTTQILEVLAGMNQIQGGSPGSGDTRTSLEIVEDYYAGGGPGSGQTPPVRDYSQLQNMNWGAQEVDFSRWWKDHGDTFLLVLGTVVGVVCIGVTAGVGAGLCIAGGIAITGTTIWDGKKYRGMTNGEAAVVGILGVVGAGGGPAMSKLVGVAAKGTQGTSTAFQATRLTATEARIANGVFATPGLGVGVGQAFQQDSPPMCLAPAW